MVTPPRRERGGPPLDRHSVLIDRETLSSISTEADYHHFTQGKPNPEEYRQWLEAILPTAAYLDGDGPPAIKRFIEYLTEQQILSEIEANIFNDYEFPHSLSARRLDMEKLISHLEDMGIDTRKMDGYRLLSRCPVCGRLRKALCRSPLQKQGWEYQG